MLQGQLILISAPSGAGKTTLVTAALAADPDLVVAISHTTRAPRVGEQDGINYHFVDEAEFERMVKADEFLEHAEVFDQRYGTSRREVAGKTESGLDVILEIDWQGAAQVRAIMPETLSCFILPPSIQALEHRLIARGQNSEESIARRLSEATIEIAAAVNFKFLFVNEDFAGCLEQLLSVIKASRQKTSVQINRPEIKTLLGL